MTPEPKTKIRDIPPTSIRLMPELRHALAREAAIKGVSLHAEIIDRLEASVSAQSEAGTAAGQVRSDSSLPDIERALLAVYRRLSPEKQLALMSLLK